MSHQEGRKELYKLEVWEDDSYNRLQIPVLNGLPYSNLKLKSFNLLLSWAKYTHTTFDNMIHHPHSEIKNQVNSSGDANFSWDEFIDGAAQAMVGGS